MPLCQLQASESVSSEDVAGRGRSRFEREAALFGAFRREWSLKLAKAVAAAFDKASKQYRLNLDAFSGSEEGCGTAGARLRLIIQDHPPPPPGYCHFFLFMTIGSDRQAVTPVSERLQHRRPGLMVS